MCASFMVVGVPGSHAVDRTKRSYSPIDVPAEVGDIGLVAKDDQHTQAGGAGYAPGDPSVGVGASGS
jgi:hypothetical protein